MGAITSWSPSRWDKYHICPARAKYDIVQKLCPGCYKGELSGGFGSPVVCSACGERPEDRSEALVRGEALHLGLEKYIKLADEHYPDNIRHPVVREIAWEFKTADVYDKVLVEVDLVFDALWNHVSKFTKGAWLRAKLDVLGIHETHARIVDWKSGGVDKMTGAPRVDAKHSTALAIYSAAVLCAFPEVQTVESDLVFVDASPVVSPVVHGERVERANLGVLKNRLTEMVRPMFEDEEFKPRPGWQCAWCPFSSEHTNRLGPCIH